MYLVDYLHQRGIGVILDWVPAHFPKDEAGLGYFDGSHLYEHADPRQGEQPDWNTFVFNYGRNEVQNFLISNALFWFDKYHVDGLRVDAVASMLYLDYGRREGQWIPNRFGGKENLDAIHFLRALNEHVYGAFPGCDDDRGRIHRLAAGVAAHLSRRPRLRPEVEHGLDARHAGLHVAGSCIPQLPSQPDHLQPGLRLHRKFRSAFLARRSRLRQRLDVAQNAGDEWQKFANLRLLYGFMFGHPGKKLLFMGDEFGQWSEWNHDASLEWHLLEHPSHAGLKRWVRDLNTLYRGQPSLHELDFNSAGFEWVDCKDSQRSVISFLRRGRNPNDQMLFVCNFTPVVRQNYRVGVPLEGYWKEILNSDAPLYGGSGQGNFGGLSTVPLPIHGRPFSLNMTLPPLGIVVFRPESPSAT